MILLLIRLRFHSMIDFVKVFIPDAIHIRKNPMLEFTNELDISTGDLSKWWVAEVNNLKFQSHNDGFVILSGSLHKYWNGGLHNWNQFTIKDLSNTINEISILFELDVDQCIFQNIEIGVNLLELIDIQKVLNGLLMHSTKIFDSGHQGYYRQCKHSEYFIKGYDKSKQFDRTKPIMRLELKFVKMRSFNKALNIYTLGEILESNDWVEKAKDLLIKRWNEIVFFDYTFNGQLDNEMLEIINPVFWNDWDKMKRSRQRDKLKKFNIENSKDHQKLIAEAITRNIQNLDNVTYSPFNYKVIS